MQPNNMANYTIRALLSGVMLWNVINPPEVLAGTRTGSGNKPLVSASIPVMIKVPPMRRIEVNELDQIVGIKSNTPAILEGDINVVKDGVAIPMNDKVRDQYYGLLAAVNWNNVGEVYNTINPKYSSAAKRAGEAYRMGHPLAVAHKDRQGSDSGLEEMTHSEHGRAMHGSRKQKDINGKPVSPHHLMCLEMFYVKSEAFRQLNKLAVEYKIPISSNKIWNIVDDLDLFPERRNHVIEATLCEDKDGIMQFSSVKYVRYQEPKKEPVRGQIAGR